MEQGTLNLSTLESDFFAYKQSLLNFRDSWEKANTEARVNVLEGIYLENDAHKAVLNILGSTSQDLSGRDGFWDGINDDDHNKYIYKMLMKFTVELYDEPEEYVSMSDIYWYLRDDYKPNEIVRFLDEPNAMCANDGEYPGLGDILYLRYMMNNGIGRVCIDGDLLP